MIRHYLDITNQTISLYNVKYMPLCIKRITTHQQKESEFKLEIEILIFFSHFKWFTFLNFARTQNDLVQ